MTTLFDKYKPIFCALSIRASALQHGPLLEALPERLLRFLHFGGVNTSDSYFSRSKKSWEGYGILHAYTDDIPTKDTVFTRKYNSVPLSRLNALLSLVRACFTDPELQTIHDALPKGSVILGSLSSDSL